MNISSKRSFYEALDSRGETAEERSAFDQLVREQCEQTGAVLITDLSGFTRTTREHGVIHFLSLFRKCQKICVPIIERHGGELMKDEADDLFALFSSPKDAISAGLQMQREIRTANLVAAATDQIGLAIGIGYGPLLRFTDDAFGDAVNIAFKLGEDLASSGEIRVGTSAFETAKSEGLDSSEYEVSELQSSKVSQADLPHFIMTLNPS